MGKRDPCAVFGCNNDRLSPEKYTVKDHISNTKLEKGDHYYRSISGVDGLLNKCIRRYFFPSRAKEAKKQKNKYRLISGYETSTTFHPENSRKHCENSNVYGTLIMKCPNCS